METLKEIVDLNENFVIKCIKKDGKILPMVVIHTGENSVIPICVIGGRDSLKMAIEKAIGFRPQIIVCMNEGYMKTVKKEDIDTYRYESGELERRFKAGENIKEVVIIQAYNKTGKLMRIIEKDTLKQVEKDTEDFDGYLTINDVERVFSFEGDVKW